jgi:hypothetical protein
MGWVEDRRRLLPELRETELELRGEGPSGEIHSIAEDRKLARKLRRLLMEYAEGLPVVPASRCPHCEAVLEIRMDPAGIDGPWWWSRCPVDWGVPDACEHFQVFLGALDFHGRAPLEADVWTVLPGPGAPFVIERLLGIEGMQAVISALQLGSGDTAYVIAYFSAEPVPPAELHAEWRRESFYVLDDVEGDIEVVTNDVWQFDLDPWLERGKLLWIEPGDGDFELHEGTACPYRNLEGTRRKQVVVAGRVDLDAPPAGGEGGLYMPHDDEPE